MITEEDRLTIACQIFTALREQMREGGTFCKLIYGRLGFGDDALYPLFKAGTPDIVGLINNSPAIKEKQQALVDKWLAEDREYDRRDCDE